MATPFILFHWNFALNSRGLRFQYKLTQLATVKSGTCLEAVDKWQFPYGRPIHDDHYAKYTIIKFYIC